jgi:pimeloyl-ACP methyl ester carboxylesterase
MRELEVRRGGRVVRVRDAGDPDGAVVVYFHGTPGSRLDLCFGEQLAAGLGVRLVSFDRPGYGGSAPALFGLASIAADAHAVADGLGVARFATLGMSGGGPGALAAAAVPGGRVTRAGIASGAGPFELVPGAAGELDDDDRRAVSLLPDDPAAAASVFAAGFEPLAELARVAGGTGVVPAFEKLLSARDRELLADQRYASAFAATMHEALRQGTSGAGWDNVSWIGRWDIELSAPDGWNHECNTDRNLAG